MHCRDAAHVLERYALLLELSGESPFKARAYSTAADVLAGLDRSLDEALESGALTGTRGIGEGILATLTELRRQGTIAHLRQLEEQIPAGVIRLTELRGVGTKKARQLWLDCGITSIEQLEHACHEHRIAACKGFSAKTEASLLDAIEFWHRTQGRLQRHTAWRLYAALRTHLLSIGATDTFAVGQLRRGCEIISELAIVVLVESHAPRLPEDFTPISTGRYRSTTRDIPIEIILASPGEVGTVLFLTTGDDDFLAAATDGAHLPSFEHEEEVFAHLGLPEIPAELREGRAIVERARRGDIPRVIRWGDMRGMLHVHTTWSDGKNTLEEMVHAAEQFGFEYIAICDHSQSAAYAGGLTPERVREQRAEIETLRTRFPKVTILHGIESDILPDGSLDYPDHILAEFDLVVASIHSHFHLPHTEQTARILRALAHPYTTILGHPTGRLLLRRDAYSVDIEALITEAARTQTVLEFNVNPYRFDLDWRYHRRACSMGVRFAINPDAHSTEGMEDLADGITVARRGELTPHDVINTLPLEQFLHFITKQRQHKHHLQAAS
ncbi:MAG: PHP domain-containing protein [Chlorobi bacterium]|nr:PHP domain-containing protein [Chlorobiota bacterium]